MSRYIGTLGSTREALATTPTTSTTAPRETITSGTPLTRLDPIKALQELTAPAPVRTSAPLPRPAAPSSAYTDVLPGGTITAASTAPASSGKGKWMLAGVGVLGLVGLLALARRKGKR
jgi:MYXO-CTERM domain-containing protein